MDRGLNNLSIYCSIWVKKSGFMAIIPSRNLTMRNAQSTSIQKIDVSHQIPAFLGDVQLPSWILKANSSYSVTLPSMVKLHPERKTDMAGQWLSQAIWASWTREGNLFMVV